MIRFRFGEFMAKERERGPFEVGSIVNVEITRILPIGVRVKLPNGHQGLIRDREIGWTNGANDRTNDRTNDRANNRPKRGARPRN